MVEPTAKRKAESMQDQEGIVRITPIHVNGIENWMKNYIESDSAR